MKATLTASRGRHFRLPLPHARQLLIGVGILHVVTILLLLAIAPPAVSIWLLAIGLVVAACAAPVYHAWARRAPRGRTVGTLHAAEQIAPLGFWSLDLNTGAMTWSKGMLRLFGSHRGGASLSIRTCWKAIHPADRPWIAALLRDALKESHEVGFCARLVRAGTDQRIVRVHLTVRRDRRGRPVLLQGACHDLTDRMSDFAEIVGGIVQADELARAKQVLLSTMSHELRTPLTGILGFAEILQEELEGDHLEFLNGIERNGKRLLRTLTAIMDLAQIEGGSVGPDAAQVCLNHEAEACIRKFAGDAAEKGLRIDLVAARPEIMAAADRALLQRLLHHLVENAIKFTDVGGVTIELESDAHQVYLHVHDTGIGISRHFLPDLFEPFRQESDGLDRNYEGSGLGLAVSKRLADLMQIDLSVRSEKGRGSTFTLGFHRVAADQRPPAPDDDAPQIRIDPPLHLVLTRRPDSSTEIPIAAPQGISGDGAARAVSPPVPQTR